MKNQTPAKSVEQRAQEWIVGEHVGASSKAIWSNMLGIDPAAHRSLDEHDAYPHDPDDFFRCKRLLDLIPEWRDRLPEMAALNPVWQALVARWPEIEASFCREAPGWPARGSAAPETYKLMRSIIEPAEDIMDTERHTIRVRAGGR